MRKKDAEIFPEILKNHDCQQESSAQATLLIGMTGARHQQCG
jgi:hypothetical protein